MGQGSCSDAQIFNRSELREMIKNGTLGHPAPEQLGEGGPICLCLDAMDGETLQQKTTHKGRKIANYRISRGRRVVGKHLCDLSEPIQGTTGHYGAKDKSCQRHCLYMWCCTT